MSGHVDAPLTREQILAALKRAAPGANELLHRLNRDTRPTAATMALRLG